MSIEKKRGRGEMMKVVGLINHEEREKDRGKVVKLEEGKNEYRGRRRKDGGGG